MKKKPFLIGNWKMHKTGSDARCFVNEFLPLIKADADICLAVPFTALSDTAQAVKGSKVLVCAQNMSEHTHGAFTGEISGSMLKEAGAHMALLGHSERRTIYGESDELIAKKLQRALKDSMRPVLCIGETETDRSKNKTEEILRNQLRSALSGLDEEMLAPLVIAYEPVWAIGTGKTATPGMAQQVHKFCREVLAKMYSSTFARHIPILYGGSVKPDSIQGLLKEPDLDGALVGGASLDPLTFSRIINLSGEVYS